MNGINILSQYSLQASKWIDIQFLIDEEEMQDLLASIGPIFIATLGKPVEGEPKSALLPPELFLESYQKYIQMLKKGEVPDSRWLNETFTLAFTKELSDLCAIQIPPNKYQVKPRVPILQVQPHRVRYSPLEKKFRSMVFGADTFSWGLQISFPQLYVNPETDLAEKAADLSSGLCFKNLQKWIRHNTQTTRFEVDNETITTSIRIGNRCFSWMHQPTPQIRVHP